MGDLGEEKKRITLVPIEEPEFAPAPAPAETPVEAPVEEPVPA